MPMEVRVIDKQKKLRLVNLHECQSTYIAILFDKPIISKLQLILVATMKFRGKDLTNFASTA